MKKKQRMAMALILALQLAAAAFLGMLIVRQERSPIVIVPSAESVSSGTAAGFAPGAELTITPDSLTADFAALAQQKETRGRREGSVTAFIVLVGDLARSGYTVSVEYSAQSEQGIAYACVNDYDTITAPGRLIPGEHRRMDFDIYALNRAESFRILFDYTGEGSFTVHSVTLRTNSTLRRMALTLWLLLCALLDAGWLCRRQLKKRRALLTVLLGITLLTSLPLLSGFQTMGHDLRFHQLRIEAVYQGLMRGELPVRTAPVFNYGVGYASPVFYCDLLLILPALLRVMGFPILWAWNGYVLAVNLLTAVIGWLCFSRMMSRKAALMADLAWCTAAYRFNDLYVRTALGEYSAMIFLPVVLLAFLRMYDEQDKHTLPQNAALMAFGMAMLTMTHILTLEMTAIVLAVAALVRCRRTFTPRVLLTWLLAAAETLLLTAWFLIPFAEYYLTVPVAVNTAGAAASAIQPLGVSVPALFGFFRNVYIDWFASKQLLTPGFMLMAVLVIGARLQLMGHGRKHERTAVIVSLLLLWASTSLFPWNALSRLPFGSVLTAVQYPWRYLTLACLPLSVLAGLLTERALAERPAEAKAWLPLAALLCAGMFIFYSGTCVQDGLPTEAVSTGDLDSMWVASSEYSRVVPAEGDDRWPGYGVTEPSRGTAAVTELTRSGNTVTLHVLAAEESTVDFPLVRYPGFAVKDAAGNSYPVSDTQDGMLRTVVPAGFDGELTTAFEPPLRWRIAEAVSVAVMVLLMLSIRKEKKTS